MAQDVMEAMGKCIVMQGIEPPQFQNVLDCLAAKRIQIHENDVIYDYEDTVRCGGLVVSGLIESSMLDRDGMKFGIRRFQCGEVFGESLGCTFNKALPVRVYAAEDAVVLLLDFNKLFTDEAACCPYASRVTRNLLREVLKKNLFLQKKVQILSQKRIRNRVQIYLSMLADGQQTLEIPMNRQELADFLGVDRSALSREFCHLRDEGVLAWKKNHVTITQPDFLN